MLELLEMIAESCLGHRNDESGFR